MRGIISAAGYIPYHRLSREAIGAAHGGGGGKGTRSVASYDEDTTSMGVEAARLALRSLGAVDQRPAIDQLSFSTTSPSYVDKTNATTIHAALRLDREVPAFDANGSIRSAAGVLRAALVGNRTALVVAADARTGLPNSTDEREGGDAAAALLVGDEPDGSGRVIAEYLGGASTTEEFLDRWRTPGDLRSKQWEERFGEMRYVPLGTEAFKLALDRSGLAPEDIATVIVTGSHARAVRQVGAKVAAGTGGLAEDLSATVGNAGAAHPALLLTLALEAATAGQVIALVVLADGCDVFLFRVTDAITAHRPQRSVAVQVSTGNAGLLYTKFLSWKGLLTVQPPNRPEPARASSSAVARNADWKFGFVGSEDRESGAIHLPPARVSIAGGNTDDMIARPMADVAGTVVTFTVDRLAYSPSPPIVFAVVDFDGGGRLPIELTDVDAADVEIGGRVEMTFRRLNQSDGIQNYFWKAKPIRQAATTEGNAS
jgi:hydroxymethylglutaryl-CoA synthase